MILGCNTQPKENFYNPVPVKLVFRNVQASTTTKTIDSVEDNVDGEEIANSNSTHLDDSNSTHLDETGVVQ